MKIEILKSPENKTEFNPGDIVKIKENVGRLEDGNSLVVGEDHSHLHLFSIGTGKYYGIFKRELNLSILEIVT